VLSKQARVHPYFPLCHVDVSAEVVLFQPRAGGYLGAQRRSCVRQAQPALR
jgi:hypothetical protein